MVLNHPRRDLVSPRSSLPPAPQIPVMRGQVILLEDVGNEGLQTFIRHPDLKVGDSLTVHWRGRTLGGIPVDAPDSEVPVLDPPPDDGLRIDIPIEFLTQIRGGEAFYSYGWIDGASGQQVESERLICYIDRSAQAAPELPVAQIFEAHDLHIDYASFPSKGSVMIAPYEAMAVGDVVTYAWQGYRGSLALPVRKGSITLDESHLGKALTLDLARSSLAGNDAGELSYTVAYKSTSVTSQSPLQYYKVGSSAEVELPPVTIDGHSGGALDPAQFPDGIPVRCPVYPGMLTGDRLWVRWQGAKEAATLQRYVDISIAESQRLLFVIPSDTARQLGSGTLTWHFSRPGKALRSEPLQVDLQVALNLPAAVVSGVTHESDADNRGYLRPEAIASAGAVTLTIPPTAEYPGATVAMHWAGHEPGGATVIGGPVSETTPRVFQVGREFIAANMGEGDDKRIQVFYRATLADQSQDSAVYQLQIKAPELASLSTLVCEPARDGTLSKKGLPSEVRFRLPEWLFMAAGQIIYVAGYGTDLDGYPVEGPLTPSGGYQVTGPDVASQAASFSKARRWFSDLKDNSTLECAVNVSFDGGHTRIPFPTLSLNVIA